MKLVAFKDKNPDEDRLALFPPAVKKLSSLGVEVFIPQDYGLDLEISDSIFQEAGAKTYADEIEVSRFSDFSVRVNAPSLDEIKILEKGSLHASFMDPFSHPKVLDDFNSYSISSISFEMIPRTTLAQKMDFLSSQANLAGYVAVIKAAESLNKIFPMMMTAAGTVTPAKVFIIGAGVAGLQAIATAKRLGAKVEAFDTRPVVEEQVQSLGAKFVKLDLGDTGQTDGGYAKELTKEQMALQQEMMAKCCEQSDVVITTAQLFGRPAPRIVTSEMIQRMKPGSVIIDLAAETGGNVEGVVAGEENTINGVSVIGAKNFPGEVPHVASQLFGNNVLNFIESYFDKDTNNFNLNLEDEIIKGCLMTHEGKTVNEMYLNITGQK
jgi:H+-translocating NAD(P) transhydrogenase subunit alpha